MNISSNLNSNGKIYSNCVGIYAEPICVLKTEKPISLICPFKEAHPEEVFLFAKGEHYRKVVNTRKVP
jgi:hypothetical protein